MAAALAIITWFGGSGSVSPHGTTIADSKTTPEVGYTYSFKAQY